MICSFCESRTLWKRDEDDGETMCRNCKRLLQRKANHVGFFDGFEAFKSSSGYVLVDLGNGKQELLHRMVYEKKFGKIPEGISIHHKDGNRMNNDISNLQAVTAKEHSSLHKKKIQGR